MPDFPESAVCLPAECAHCQEYSERICELEDRNQTLKLIEETLHRNIALFQAMLSRSKEGVALIGPNRNIVRMVHSFAGYAPAEVSGIFVENLVHPDDRAIIVDCYRQVVDHPGASVEFEVRALGADGSFMWVEGTLTDMLDDPNVQAIVCNYADCTLQREEEMRLAEFEAIVERVEYATFSTGTTGAILTWNRGAERAVGYTAAEIVGRNVEVLVPDDLREQHVRMHRSVCETGIAVEFRTEGLHKSGARAPILIQLAPIPDRYGRVQAVAHISKRLP
jgi:PAS domain S-box-containing protein